jgi:2-amino-4-hydroxy-6-hydroxymethyldihydropteridine diphosphokinase
LNRAYLALGSNLGDRLGHLQAAVDAIAATPGVVVAAVSRVYETEPVGPQQPQYLNAVVAVDTDWSARELLGLAQSVEEAAQRVRDERWGPRTLDVDDHVDEPDLVVPHPRMWERGFVLAPLADVAPELIDSSLGPWEGVAVTDLDLTVDAGDDRTFALVGPGRAGTTISLLLLGVGWRATAVAGRAPDRESTRAAALALECPVALASDVARGAALVVIATPDAMVEATAESLVAAAEPGALVVHLAGSLGLDALAPLAEKRPDVRLGALHPLQTIPSAREGLDRVPGSWAAVAGDPAVEALARDLGLRPFPVADADRARYHAAAVVASNHLVALLGQVERLAATAGVPFEAFVPLVEASLDNAVTLGPAAALTGPIARGDLQTVERHLAALPSEERDAYRALARAAMRLAGRRSTAADRLLRDLE